MTWSGYSETGTGSEERGPNTFSFSPQGSPQAQAQGIPMARMGYNTAPGGNGIVQLQGAPQDKTLDILAGFAKEKLAPVIQQAKAKQFLAGMTRAAAGEALTEIINEQPWFSRIFGEGAVIEGARSYTSQAEASKMTAEIESRMKELRKVGPEQFPDAILAMNDKFMTGDPQTDVQVRMHLLKTLPGLVARHTKENYAYLQEQAHAARFEATTGAGNSLQAAHAANAAFPGSYSPEFVEQRRGELWQSLALKPGEDQDAWSRSIKTFIQGQAQAGNFHTLAEVDKQILKSMTPEDQLNVTTYINQQKKAHAMQARELYSTDKQRIDYYTSRVGIDAPDNPFKTGRDVVNAYQEIERKYQQASGNDSPVFTSSTVNASVMTVAQAQAWVAHETSKANAKLAQAQGEADGLNADITQMTYNEVKAGGVHKTSVLDAAWMAKYWNGKPPELQIAAIAKHSGGEVPAFIKTQFEVDWNRNSGQPDNRFYQGYRLWKLGQELQPTLGEQRNITEKAIFSDKQIAAYRTFDTAMAGEVDMTGPKAVFAFGEAVGAMNDLGKAVPKDQQPQVVAAIQTAVQGKEWQLGETQYTSYGHEKGRWGQETLDPSTIRLLSPGIARSLQLGLPAQEALDRAVKGGGYEMIGNKVITTLAGSTSMLDRMVMGGASNRAEVAYAFNAALEKETAKVAGSRTIQDRQYVRLPDQDGQATIAVQLRDEDGAYYYARVSEGMLRDEIAVARHSKTAKAKAQAAAERRSKLQFGPKTKWGNAPSTRTGPLYDNSPNLESLRFGPNITLPK